MPRGIKTKPSYLEQAYLESLEKLTLLELHEELGKASRARAMGAIERVSEELARREKKGS